MKKFDFKTYLYVLFSLTLLFFVVSFVQLPYLFENGEYAQYTASILQDRDLNIVNQVKDPEVNWIVTQTGNYAAHRLYGTAAYLVPFFMYKQVIEGPVQEVNDFLYSQALSTVFYVFLGMVLLWKVLSQAGVKKLGTALFLLVSSTSVLWYFFFISSSTNIFSLGFSLLAFVYFYLTLQDEIKSRHFFLFGMILGLGLLIRIQLYWLALVPIVLLAKDRKHLLEKSILYVLGAVLLQTITFVNSYIRNGRTENFPFLLFWKSFSIDLFLNSVKYSIWGPNGYLTVSPVYLGILAAAVGCWIFYRNKKSDLVNISLFLLFAPAGILVAQSLIGQLQDCLAGRHLLTYFFLFFILSAVFLSKIYECSRKSYFAMMALVFVAICWNLVATGSFYYRDTVDFWRWNTSYQISLENALRGLNLFLSRVSIGWINASHSVVSYFPLLLVLAVVLYKAVKADQQTMKKICLMFFGYGIVSMFIITACNFFNNAKNVRQYTQEGLYQGKVVVKSTEALLYDDFIEMNRMSMRYYAHNGRCDLVQKSKDVIHQFLESISPDIIIDPVHFKDDLSRGILRKSGFEDKEAMDALEQEMKDNCPMLERNTY